MELEGMQRLEAADAAAVDGGDGGRLEKILVSVRLRPLSAKEIAANDACDWDCIEDTSIIFRNSLGERSIAPSAYTFDKVFSAESTTKKVYEEGAKKVALSVVSGINSTIFAYGQTSSGKTYTMTGITEYTGADIYDYIKRHEERDFILKFSAIEIYNEVVRDLLSVDSTPLRVLDDPEKGTVVEKLTVMLLRDWKHLKELIAVCEAQRRIGETLLNEMSSRSHQILRLTIESSARDFLDKDSSGTLSASVNFVDLAGSERASQAFSVGSRLKEGCHINRSLLTLGTVIRKLSKGRNGHIPYRDSKLTRILQPSLGGNSRTAIICTICPARSHIEQSRNTLLFASCAKEVVTSAHVNVVMSDKALVKHLRREIAKLEGELKHPRSSAITCNFEALLREKNAQIIQMEKEIKELIQQRDTAQIQLEDFLQDVGSGHPSSQSEESDQMSTPGLYKTCEDVSPTSESSISCKKSGPYGRNSRNENKGHNVRAPLHPIIPLIESIPREAEEEIVCERDEDSETFCKEVQCIEMDGPVKSGDSESLLADLNPHEQIVLRPDHPKSTYITLEQHLQYVRERLRNFAKAYPGGSSPCSRSLVLSRSFRETVMKNSPCLFGEEQSNTTPPCTSHRDCPGRTERFQKCVALNYGDDTAAPSRDDSQNFERSTCNSVFEGDRVTGVSNGGMSNIHDFVAGLKMARVHYQKVGEDSPTQELSRGIGLNPIESPSSWLIQFEKKQQEIIQLWHACNVSLVHRTCFFLFFKGDPTDSIYMEVELRRLSFLKRTLTRENVALASSMRRLRWEREMLFKQMQKRFSSEERACLYMKWGITLDSKQRKWQLVRRLWTETGDLQHVRESVSIVAKLIGVSEEPGHAFQEMFGLSFAPENCSRRSFKWKHDGVFSFK